jgi:polyketide cyclase/dehydrase/lipid transport protein
MPQVEMDIETTLSPQTVLDALTDFSDKRPDIWPGIDPELYEVRSIGETEALIKEGSSTPGMKIWAIEHYDWSEPGTVKWTVMESNFSSPGDFVSAKVTPKDGGSSIHITWNRTGANFLGKFVARVIKLTNGKPVAASIRKALDRMEKQQQA